MTLALVVVAVWALATFLIARMVIRDRRELRHWQAERQTADALIAYHAQRSRDIREVIDALGDDAQHLFPPATNGND